MSPRVYSRSHRQVARRLDGGTAAAVASGEYIVRPASVVKELCENSIDAGAQHIEVAVREGGYRRIIVSDDGSGISADDLPLAVSLHATSKVETLEDLSALRTLGFRGDALACIAAVSDLRLRSKTEHQDSGTALRCCAGEIIDQHGVALDHPGTEVEIRDLFFNVARRLKYVRHPRTEAALCRQTVAQLAVAWPSIAWTFRDDEGTRLATAGSGNLSDVLAVLYGRAAAVDLVAVSLIGGRVSVSGAISSYYSNGRSRPGWLIVVNGRLVEHNGLLAVLNGLYCDARIQGRAFGVIRVDLEPTAVAVELAGAKARVRFRDDGGVRRVVEKACRSALARSVPSSPPPPDTDSGSEPSLCGHPSPPFDGRGRVESGWDA